MSFCGARGRGARIAYLLGSGRTELLRCIFGRDRADSGVVTVDGERVADPTEREMIRRGVGLTPEDRKRQGAILPLSVQGNLTLAAFDRFFRGGILNSERERELASSVAQRLAVKAGSLSDPVQTLSGGNQQKVVIGKWVAAGSEILLLDEPTRGIDIHAKQQVYDTVRALARGGAASSSSPSELEELFEVCHTIAVMNHGRLTDVIAAAETSLQDVVALAMREVVAG